MNISFRNNSLGGSSLGLCLQTSFPEKQITSTQMLDCQLLFKIFKHRKTVNNTAEV